MPHILSFDDLRNTEEISSLCHAHKEPIFIAQNDTIDLVVMSLDTYHTLMESIAVDTAILEAEAEYAQNGEKHDAAAAMAMLRKKL